MYKRTTGILAFYLVFLATSAIANTNNLSITDFTMHKVSPTQGAYSEEAATQPPSKAAQPVLTKQIQQKIVKTHAKPTAKQPFEPIKTAKITPVEQNNYPKIQNNSSEKVTEKTYDEQAQSVETDSKTEIVQTETPQTKEYNEQDIVNNLNKRLEQDNIIPNNAQLEQKAALKTFNAFDYYVKPFLSLGIVIVLIFIVAWLYNKLRVLSPNVLLSGKLNGMDLNKFTVLASSALGQGKIIHLVEINGKQLVVGSTNNNISLLTEINPEDLEKLKAKAENNRQNNVSLEPQEIDEIDEFEHAEPESYSARYSNVYKDYVE